MIRHWGRQTMLGLETISYLLSTLRLAWSGGWLFTPGHQIGSMLCCALGCAQTFSKRPLLTDLNNASMTRMFLIASSSRLGEGFSPLRMSFA